MRKMRGCGSERGGSVDSHPSGAGGRRVGHTVAARAGGVFESEVVVALTDVWTVVLRGQWAVRV